MGNGVEGWTGEGHETERAGCDYGLRVVGYEIGQRGLGNLGTVTGIQSQASQTTAATDAFVTFLGGRDQSAHLGKHLAWFFINTTASAEFTWVVIDKTLLTRRQFQSAMLDQTLDILRIMKDLYPLQVILILENLITNRTGED